MPAASHKPSGPRQARGQKHAPTSTHHGATQFQNGCAPNPGAPFRRPLPPRPMAMTRSRNASQTHLRRGMLSGANSEEVGRFRAETGRRHATLGRIRVKRCTSSAWNPNTSRRLRPSWTRFWRKSPCASPDLLATHFGHRFCCDGTTDNRIAWGSLPTLASRHDPSTPKALRWIVPQQGRGRAARRCCYTHL